ncbi:transposase [Micromonospora andamanensis]|nr:transposase [Micromonospora andamanensis]
MAAFLARHENIRVSHNFIADLWRQHGLQPPVRHLQTLPGSGGRRQGRRHRRAVPEPARRGCRSLCRREDEGAGVGPDPASAADRLRPYGEAHPRLRPARHGTTNLFAALDAAPAQGTARCCPKRRGIEFLAFMKTVAAAYRDRKPHVVVDNLSAHTTDEVNNWLGRHPRIVFHFTPTGSSWLNMVGIWFSIITR